MKINWTKIEPGVLMPPEKRYVLLQVPEIASKGKPPAVVVGYLRYAAGDYLSPMFVVPGAYTVCPTWFSDCLGDSFSAPLWSGGQGMDRKRPRRRRLLINEWPPFYLRGEENN